MKGGIEVGGLRKDWSIGRARRCNLGGENVGGVPRAMLLLCTFNGGCSSCSTKSKALCGLIPHSAKGEKTMKRKRNREKQK